MESAIFRFKYCYSPPPGNNFRHKPFKAFEKPHDDTTQEESYGHCINSKHMPDSTNQLASALKEHSIRPGKRKHFDNFR